MFHLTDENIILSLSAMFFSSLVEPRTYFTKTFNPFLRSLKGLTD